MIKYFNVSNIVNNPAYLAECHCPCTRMLKITTRLLNFGIHLSHGRFALGYGELCHDVKDLCLHILFTFKETGHEIISTDILSLPSMAVVNY